MSVHSSVNRSRLMLIGKLSIFMIGLGFAVRANIAADLQADLFDLIDPLNSAAMVGQALGITFAGFAFTLLFGSVIVDVVGMKPLLLLSALGYILGSLLVIVTAIMPVSEFSYWLISFAFLLTGLGWGAVEAATNPMVASLYPDDKTHRLNVLHAWWPAGIVVGGLVGVGFGVLELPWAANLLLLIVPAVVLAWLVLGTEYPVSERVASGVSYADMVKEIARQPLFVLWLICMVLTTSSELAPGQWVDLALSRQVGIEGILLLVYVSVLMFVMRHFAGPIARRLSAVGLLWLSSLLAAVGLYSLSLANSPLTALAAATLWGTGVCFMWPTMLASVSERFPRGGALFLGLTGFAGGMAIYFVLPQLGRIFDQAKLVAAGGAEQLLGLSGEAMEEVLRIAAVESFQAIAFVPLALLPIFSIVWLLDRRQVSAVVVAE